MKRLLSLCVAAVAVVATTGYSATFVVNTTDNTDFSAGVTNLSLAITLANASGDPSDTINFSIAGAGPHYLLTPVGGYPLITKHNVTINGYSQAGAVPNSNPILSNNNAQIKIVLTSTNGNYTVMDYNSSTNNGAGFGSGNRAVLAIYGATNTQIRGLSILGTKVSASGGITSIGIARDSKRPLASAPFSQSTTPQVTGAHISGCWLGVDPNWTVADLTNSFPDNHIASCNNHVAAFSHRQERYYRVTYVCNGVTNTTPNNNIAMPNRDLANRESDRDVVGLWLSTNDFSACTNLIILSTNFNDGRGNRVGHHGIIVGVKPGSADPRAEFNVIVSGWINLIMEGQAFRVSGNFLGVLPSGTNDYIPSFAEPPNRAESHIEFGRGASDMVVGIDGDGVNDADERNIMGGVVTGGGGGSYDLGGYQHVIEFYSLSGGVFPERTRNRIAGNYIGVGVDGMTRFTNGVPAFNGSAVGNDGLGQPSQVWFGPDFNGVSDDLEANVMFNNYPAGLFYATDYTNSTRSGATSHGFMDQPEQNAIYSTRGNKIVNNYPYHINPRRGQNPANVTTAFGEITTYVNKALAVAQPNSPAGYYGLYPTISASSTTARLIGTAPANNATYPYLILDVYLPDPEGLTNGLVVPDPFLTNGWVHGKTYLGSFVDNSWADQNPAVGAFDFNICNLGLSGGTEVTISANYSKDAPGTHNARVLTSLFSVPRALTAANCFVVTSAASSGAGSFSNALYTLVDGGYITFNLAGAGPHYIETPSGGHPLIIRDNVTLDGYTQPGSCANTNPITASNTAVIKIVLDSRNGNYRNMNYTCFDGTEATSVPAIDNTSMTGERPGYGSAFCLGGPEVATLGIYRATNVNVRGLAFLGDPAMSGYSIALAHDYGLNTNVLDRLAYDAGSSRNCHINGCWFGINPTNPTPAGLAPDVVAVAYFRHRDVSGGPRPELPNESLIVGVKAGSSNPRAEFNVMPYMAYSLAGEGIRTRVSGNFVGVLPDGVTPSGVPAYFDDAIETRRYTDTEPIFIGTDGDGVNDAHEGNLFGPIDGTVGEADVIGFYAGGDLLTVVSGNRFGIAVDGTRWASNSQSIVKDGNVNSVGKLQFGSDFNGVSDAAEANVVYNNHPFDTLFPSPVGAVPPDTIGGDAGARISVRGNTFVNCALVPYMFANNLGTRLTAFTNYEAPFFEPASPIIPKLSAKSTGSHILGTAAKAVGIYTNVIVDVYLADYEGWTNGIKTALMELTDNATYTNGFPQGKTYKGSVNLGNNFPGGDFDINVGAMGLSAGNFVTIAVNYSGDPPGTTRGRAHTSNFANPVTLLAPIVITSISVSGTTVTINWTGGAPPYTLQKKSPFTGAWVDVTTGIVGTSTTDTVSGTEAYYQIVDP